LDKPLADTRVITAHLGNGASMAAVDGGKSVDTSMGFSPLAGLMMGTRSGDLDPAVVLFLASERGMSSADIDRILNKQSGLTGICGENDLRDIEHRAADGDDAAQLALDMYAYRIKKYIGMYTAVLGTVDALIFTAGVGENSNVVRQKVCAGLEHLGWTLDQTKNAQGVQGVVTEIQADASRSKILIIPTNEELEIALQTEAVLTD
jgi:acetate kinase